MHQKATALRSCTCEDDTGWDLSRAPLSQGGQGHGGKMILQRVTLPPVRCSRNTGGVRCVRAAWPEVAFD